MHVNYQLTEKQLLQQEKGDDCSRDHLQQEVLEQNLFNQHQNNNNRAQFGRKFQKASYNLSEFLQQYNQFMSIFNINFKIQDHWQILKQNNIKILSKIQFNQKIILKWFSKNQKIFIFDVYLNLFLIEVSVYCLENDNFLNWELYNFNLIDSGTFGQIFQPKRMHSSQKYVLKKLPIVQKQYRIAKPLLKQVALIKLFSSLQISLPMKFPFGFDILSTKYANYFAMEEGVKINHLKTIKIEKLKNDLGRSLKIMHSLQFIHFDIKLTNIMFSQTLKKFVFIDFGLTTSIRQQIGMKSLSGFKGSYQCASSQMQNLFQTADASYVDLYYNDMHGLKLAFQTILKSKLFNFRKNNSDEASNEYFKDYQQILLDYSSEIQYQRCLPFVKETFNTYQHRNFIKKLKLNQSQEENNQAFGQQLNFHQGQNILKDQKYYLFLLKSMYFIFRSNYKEFSSLIKDNKSQFNRSIIQICDAFYEINLIPVHLAIYVNFFFENLEKLMKQSFNQKAQRIIFYFSYKKEKDSFGKEIDVKANQFITYLFQNQGLQVLKNKQKSKQKVWFSNFQYRSSSFTFNLIFEINNQEQFQVQKYILFQVFLDKYISRLQAFIEVENQQKNQDFFISEYLSRIQASSKLFNWINFKGSVQENPLFIILEEIQKFALTQLSAANTFKEGYILFQKLLYVNFILNYDKLVHITLPKFYMHLLLIFQGFNQRQETDIQKSQFFFKIMNCFCFFIFAFYAKSDAFYMYSLSQRIAKFQKQYLFYIESSKERKTYFKFLNLYMDLVSNYFNYFISNPFKIYQKCLQAIQFYESQEIQRIQRKYQCKEQCLTIFLILIQSLRRLKNINELILVLQFIQNNFNKYQNPSLLLRFCDWAEYAYQKFHRYKLSQKYRDFVNRYQITVKYYQNFKKKSSNIKIQGTPGLKMIKNQQNIFQKVQNLILRYKYGKFDQILMKVQQTCKQISQTYIETIQQYYKKYNSLIHLNELLSQVIRQGNQTESRKAFNFTKVIANQIQSLLLCFGDLFKQQFHKDITSQKDQKQVNQSLILMMSKQIHFYLSQCQFSQQFNLSNVIEIQYAQQMRLYCIMLLKLNAICQSPQYQQWLQARIQFFDQIIKLHPHQKNQFIQYYEIKQNIISVATSIQNFTSYRQQMKIRFPFSNSHTNKVFNIFLLGKQLYIKQQQLLILKRQLSIDQDRKQQQNLLKKYQYQTLISNYNTIFDQQLQQLLQLGFNYYNGYLFFIFTNYCYGRCIQDTFYNFLNRLIYQYKWKLYIKYIIKITKLIENQKYGSFETARQLYSNLIFNSTLEILKFNNKSYIKFNLRIQQDQKIKSKIQKRQFYKDFLLFHYQFIIATKITENKNNQKQQLTQFYGYLFFIAMIFLNKLCEEQKIIQKQQEKFKQKEKSQQKEKQHIFNQNDIIQLKNICAEIILTASVYILRNCSRVCRQYARSYHNECIIKCIEFYLNQKKKIPIKYQASRSQLDQISLNSKTFSLSALSPSISSPPQLSSLSSPFSSFSVSSELSLYSSQTFTKIYFNRFSFTQLTNKLKYFTLKHLRKIQNQLQYNIYLQKVQIKNLLLDRINNKQNKNGQQNNIKYGKWIENMNKYKNKYYNICNNNSQSHQSHKNSQNHNQNHNYRANEINKINNFINSLIKQSIDKKFLKLWKNNYF